MSITLVSPVSRDQSHSLSISIVLRHFCDTGMSISGRGVKDAENLPTRAMLGVQASANSFLGYFFKNNTVKL